MIRYFAFLLLLAPFALSGCQQLKADMRETPAEQPADFKPDILGAEQATSDAYGEPQIIGTITDPKLSEISGLTPSRTGKNLWWVHNDSGNEPKLYVINTQGKKLGEFTVTDATNNDWEDMAGYKGKDGKAFLYLADSGNNGGTRDDLALYRVPEPNLNQSQSGETEPAESFKFRYPTGKQDAEALFVDPATGRPYLVTKTTKSACAVYRFPWPLRADETMTLEKVAGAGADAIGKLTLVTGAATSADGMHLVVRTYFTALELSRAKGKPFESIFAAEPIRIKIPLERQGEAISYTLDGQSIITTSEKVPAPIFQLKRKTN